MMYHNPVLLNESISGLNINPSGIYVDVTYGGGGHSQEILKNLNSNGKLIAFDQDQDAIENRSNDSRLNLVKSNFKYLNNFLNYFQIKEIDGLLADFGISSHQIDNKNRGFSTRFNSELDMRMNSTQKIDAKIIINDYDKDQLEYIFKNFGELKNYKKVTEKIISERTKKFINTTGDLKKILAPLVKLKDENKFLAQVFQSIRIEVNDEIGCLKKLLNQIPKVLKPNGIASIITYHSIEDRLVKRFFKNGNFNKEPEKDEFGNIKTIFKIKKFIKPNDLEIKENPRSRSAKLRVAKLIWEIK